MLGEEVDEGHSGFDYACCNLKLGNTFKHGKERVFVDFVECLTGMVAEEDLRSLDCGVAIFGRVDHCGDFAGKALLQRAFAGVLCLLCYEGFDFLAAERGENLDILFGIGIAHIEPELIEFVWGSALGVEPHVAAFGLAKFAAVGLGDERAGESECIHIAGDAANEFGTGGDITPLVATAELEAAIFVLIEVEEVVALEELVREFGERHALLIFAIEALLHRVLSHHIVYGDVLTDVADKGKEAVIFHPVVVVHEFGTVFCVAFKVEEFGKLLFDSLLVVAESFLVDEFTLLRFHRRVANHTGSTANQSDGLVARALEVLEHHHTHQVPDVERIGCRVDTKIGGSHFLI